MGLHRLFCRGEEAPHLKSKGQKRSMHEFHFDWAHPSNEDEEKGLNTCVGRMRDVRMTLSSVSPPKGVSDFISKRVFAFLRECGCEMADIVIRSDQDASLMAQLGSRPRAGQERRRTYSY